MGTITTATVAACCAWRTFAGGSLQAGEWFRMDMLSAWHLVLMAGVFSAVSLYAVGYFSKELESGAFSRGKAARYAALWFGAMDAMTVVLLTDNLGVMWVGIEATTLLTAFMILTHSSPASLEAMWKYLLMCSVGVALAFIGVILAAASAESAGLTGAQVLSWTHLLDAAGSLSSAHVKMAFIFAVVGYGTKAGLAPMHSWLPDAHSQAPAPVSAMFSAFMLNAALYCVLRSLALVEAVTGSDGWGREVLLVLGLVSVLLAAVFIVGQRDIKRLLAYSSVEHIGLIAVGIGLGGAGAAAALLHAMNHSVAKTLSFMSAGRIGQAYGTNDMRRISGALHAEPLWGTGLLLGIMMLAGMAPFGIFLSEFLILKSALEGGRYLLAGALLAGLVAVFVGVMRHAIGVSWGAHEGIVRNVGAGWLDRFLVAGAILVSLVLGIWPCSRLWHVLEMASALTGGMP